MIVSNCYLTKKKWVHREQVSLSTLYTINTVWCHLKADKLEGKGWVRRPCQAHRRALIITNLNGRSHMCKESQTLGIKVGRTEVKEELTPSVICWCLIGKYLSVSHSTEVNKTECFSNVCINKGTTVSAFLLVKQKKKKIRVQENKRNKLGQLECEECVHSDS